MVDEVKREIVDLYEEDFTKIDGTGLAGDIYDAIPASLSRNASRYVLSNAREGMRSVQVREIIPDILSSYTVNIAYHANNPGAGMAVTSITKGDDGSRTPTLIISMGGYDLNFQSEELV